MTRLVEELSKVRRLCPTYGPPYALEGQLQLSVLGDPAGEDLILKGVRLAPYDGPTCLIAGEVAARAGRVDEAVSLLRRAVVLAPEFFGEAAGVMLETLDRPADARKLTGEEYGRLVQLAEIAASKGRTALAAELQAAAEARLRKQVESEKASAAEIARLAALEDERGNKQRAVELYRRALVLNYNAVDWRFALAQALATLGEDVQALREARIVLQLRPNHAPAKNLADELSLRVTVP